MSPKEANVSTFVRIRLHAEAEGWGVRRSQI